MLLFACLNAAGQQPLFIRNVTIVDVASGELKPPANVLIQRERIAAIGPLVFPPANALIIDGSKKFLIPGLWDMHGYATASDPRAFLAYGITGLRDMGSDLGEALALYTSIEAGKVPGPRLLTSGPGIHAENAGEARAAFDRIFDTAADFISFHRDINFEAYVALAESARHWRYPLVGPLPASIHLRDAIQLRQASVEHLTGLDRLSRKEACDGFAQAGNMSVWFTPTVAWHRSRPPRSIARKSGALVQLMTECGAHILAGSGSALSNVRGVSIHDELAALVDSGLTPAAALRSATLEPARFLNAEDGFGAVEIGRFADLVLLDGDPLEDISNTERIAAVITRGRWHSRATLATWKRPPAPAPPPPVAAPAAAATGR